MFFIKKLESRQSKSLLKILSYTGFFMPVEKVSSALTFFFKEIGDLLDNNGIIHAGNDLDHLILVNNLRR